MIDTAGTITAGVDILKKKGAKDVYIACTHGVLSGPAIDRLKECDAKEIVVTDTIPLPPEKYFDRMKIVTVADLLAHTIDNIENNLPVSDVVLRYDWKD
jgi:ribose-phosphate pyrophosphokinase